jgi:hypothetical protein
MVIEEIWSEVGDFGVPRPKSCPVRHRLIWLGSLALYKINRTLRLFNLDTPKLKHIIDFVRYAYSDERTPDLENTIDGLRGLICEYIATNAEFTSRDATFMALFEEGGPFARDLWKLVAPRVNQS